MRPSKWKALTSDSSGAGQVSVASRLAGAGSNRSRLVIRICGVLVAAALAYGSVGSVHADRLTFKDGRILDNVKVSVTQTQVVVRSSDGRTTRYDKRRVRSLRRHPVRWAPKSEKPVTKGAHEPEVGEPKSPRNRIERASKEEGRSPVKTRAAVAPSPRALLWAAVFPGLGHFSQGRKAEGSVYVLAGIILVGAMAERYGTFLAHESDYGDSSRLVGFSMFAPSGVRASSFYVALQRQQENRAAARRAAQGINRAAGLFAALYAWNFFDIAFLGKTESVKGAMGPGGFYLSFQERF